MPQQHDVGQSSHSHGAAIQLPAAAKATLQRGLQQLVELSRGLAFQPTISERYPLPLALAVHGRTPDPDEVRRDITGCLTDDPIAALERALVLLEVVESNNPATMSAVPDDGAFLSECFNSKRMNGWVATLGGGDRAELEAAINGRWKFKFVGGGEPYGPLYVLVNMLVRYGFVYGRIEPGDSHALGHFVEDFTPGLLVCRQPLSDLDLTLSLAAMKLGVPAVVPPDYPFPLGRTVRTDSAALDEIVASVTAFPNIRRLLDLPGIPPLPDYLDPENLKTEFTPTARWGDTPESFCILRKGKVSNPGSVTVAGQPAGPLGVVITVEGRPLDAFDRRYIEARACRTLSMIRGLRASLEGGKLRIEMAAGTPADPQQIGQTLIAAIRHEFPKLKKVAVELIFDRQRLVAEINAVAVELKRRTRQIETTTEEKMTRFVTCVGCSPFAPDHVCILTPERPPQCGRAYEQIKTGALYDYDDLTSIHHRGLHASINSFGTCLKGEPINAAAGEWSGVNEAVTRLTGGRTTRVQLHSLAKAPHTGCGCFRLIMFHMTTPAPGIGIMDRTYKGAAPDRRTWRDLHYALGGKQAVGLAGGTPAYLRSPKFLAGDGGWARVVWVSPKIAEFMGESLPAGVEIGRNGA